jgi:hypothetical protein
MECELSELKLKEQLEHWGGHALVIFAILGSLHRCTTRITLYSLVIKKWVLKQLLPS